MVDHALFPRGTSSDFMPCCFMLMISSSTLLFYVDDIIITSPSSFQIAHIKQALDHQFTIKDLSSLKYFLGIEVTRFFAGIHIDQHKYTLYILNSTGYLASKPISTPMVTSLKLQQLFGTPSVDP